MVYLHKSVFQSHGYLSSTNCHVDSRWVLKISGFALHAMRKQDSCEQVNMSSPGNVAAVRCTCIYSCIRLHHLRPWRFRNHHHFFLITVRTLTFMPTFVSSLSTWCVHERVYAATKNGNRISRSLHVKHSFCFFVFTRFGDEFKNVNGYVNSDGHTTD